MQGIARLRRRSVGRRTAPRLCIIDTQAVKCISVRGPRGYDAGKRVVVRYGMTVAQVANVYRVAVGEIKRILHKV